ncbi:MATE family efflux transporter [Desulfurispirillum indicum]|uniref:MATE family efflux transporter n=1 Tax=Desulfurispirillum indicum TaxID=936456 RepID=UPI001CF997D4|nr:MATE family efflux transporter [Desulfurispirillum indicum]UCZ56389.1 MATE family efflux transporter [Desulfurispirillum indicum]
MKSTSDNKHFLEQAPVSRVFLKYALPSIVTMVFFGLQSLVDGIVVGNHLGPDALGGINIILPLFSIIMVLALIVGIGSQTLVSMELGRRNPEKAQDAMSTGFKAMVGISAMATVLLLLFAEPLIRLMGADERLLPFSLAYLTGLTPFILPLSLCFYSDAMLKALGHPRFSMVIMSLTVVINVLLSLYFVIGLDWGTAGASAATGVAFTVGLLISGSITFNPKQRLSMLKGRFRLPLLLRAAYNGSSEGVSEMAAAATILIINLTVVRLLGADGVAAFTAINYINFMGVLLFLGISDGLIPVLSYNYGARNYERVKRFFRFAAVVNMSIGTVVFILLQVFGGHAILLFFDSSESQAFQIAAEGLHLFAFVFLANGLNMLIIASFTALGEAKNSLVISVLRGLVFVLIGVTVLPVFFGIHGVWLAIPLAEVLSLGVALLLVRRIYKRLSGEV